MNDPTVPPQRPRRSAPPTSASSSHNTAATTSSASGTSHSQPPSSASSSSSVPQRTDTRTTTSPARTTNIIPNNNNIPIIPNIPNIPNNNNNTGHPHQQQQRQDSSDSLLSSSHTTTTSNITLAHMDQQQQRNTRFPEKASMENATQKSNSSSSLSTMGESIGQGGAAGKDVPLRNRRGGGEGVYQQQQQQLEEGYQALPGEEEKLVSKTVQLSCPHTDTLKNGLLTVTNYRVIFRAMGSAMDSFEVPLSSIMAIDKVPAPVTNRTENAVRIRLLCKDLRKISLSITKNTEQPNLKSFLETLRQLAFPVSAKRQLFAFDYQGKYPSDGWSVYSPKGEFQRQGVPNDMWRISKVNEKYELSDTYPSVIAVPTAASDDFLKDVAAFRSRGRIPVLSWIHPATQATITRSSQPQVGVKSHSKEDQGYIKMIHDANPVCPRLCIMDARPMANAVANRAKGGGYESEENYPSIELVFLNIHNIHVMRESLRKVQEMCSPRIEDATHFYSNLEATHWLLHIKTILAGALKIVDKVETYKSSVLVHCSDGWDRTAQLTSLSMIMLDPYYRTIRGFEVLVEKEWVSFGHKFAHRIGHGEEKLDSDRSPVFLQFIDCVWQLTQQFDVSFEFNERFLIAILDHLYGCRYGTFLCNCEKEHIEKGLKSKTISLWSYINSNLDDFRNPYFYEQPKNAPGVNHILYPLTTHRYLKLWMRYYARWDPSTKQQEPVDERYKQILFAYQKLTELRDNLKREAAGMKKPTGGKAAPPTTVSPSASTQLTGPVHV